MIKQILRQGDEVLGKPCVVVTVFDDSVRALVADMWDTMYAAHGAGLAATQIGSSLRVAVIDVRLRPNSNRRLVLVNPRITSRAGEYVQTEGCLSMPGKSWSIPRAERVTVEFQDMYGRHQELRGRGWLARAIQHECDHLNGILCNALARGEA